MSKINLQESKCNRTICQLKKDQYCNGTNSVILDRLFSHILCSIYAYNCTGSDKMIAFDVHEQHIS